MISQYDQHLDRNTANFAALTPLSFIERTACGLSRPPGHRAWRACARPGRKPMPAAGNWPAACARSGIGKNDTVAVMLPNTPPMVEAHFGVPMAGRCSTP